MQKNKKLGPTKQKLYVEKDTFTTLDYLYKYGL